MKDHIHFITKDGFIFTTKGDIHDEQYVRSAALYRASTSGKRELCGINYEKEIDELGTGWLRKAKLDYCVRDEIGPRILVPTKDITDIFDPFSVFEFVKWKTKDTQWKQLVDELEKIFPREDIGFIGSYLIGFPSLDSDLDIVIRGKDNLAIAKQEIDNLRSRLGAVQVLDSWREEVSLKKYHAVFNSDFNDFMEMIKRRWSTIRTSEFMLKLRFAYKYHEIPSPTFRHSQGERTIIGNVLVDDGVNFMPRVFTLMGNDHKIYQVFTYFWDYSFCVTNGDRVSVKASLFDENKLLLKEPKEHGIRFIHEN